MSLPTGSGAQRHSAWHTTMRTAYRSKPSLRTATTYYLRAKAAGTKAAELIQESNLKNKLKLSKQEKDTLNRVITDLKSLPDDAEPSSWNGRSRNTRTSRVQPEELRPLNEEQVFEHQTTSIRFFYVLRRL